MTQRERWQGDRRVDLSAHAFHQLFRELTNWGRWSERAEVGALNYLTADRIAAAARLVRGGTTVSLGRPLNTHRGVDNPKPAHHEMTMLPDVDIGSGSVRFAKDYIGVDYHNEEHSHIDALCHVAYEGFLYGGTPDSGGHLPRRRGRRHRPAPRRPRRSRSATRHTHSGAFAGSSRESTCFPTTSKRRSGRRASAWMSATSCSSARDMCAVSPSSGRGTRARPRWACTRRRRGSSQYRRVAALGSEGNNDTAPSTTEGVAFPIHVLAINAMGIHLLDYLQFEDLVRRCEEAERWEFLFVAAPLRIDGGTGSPVNPIAIL